MFDWISENPEGATLLATIIVAVATVIYAVLTGLLVVETVRMRRAQTEPKLAAYFEPDEQAVIFGHLYVKNIGLGPAYDVTFDLIPEGNKSGGERLIADFKKRKFFERGVQYIGPGQHLRSGVTQMNENYQEKIAATVRVRMRYRPARGSKLTTDEYPIDFSELEGYSQLGKPPIHAIANTLEKMQTDLRWLVNGMRRLQVDQYTQGDRDREKRELDADRRRRRAQAKRGSDE